METLKHLGHFRRSPAEAALRINVAKDIAHRHRQLAQVSEGRDAVGCRTLIRTRLGCVSKRRPVFELLKRVKEFDGNQSIGFPQACWATLIEALDLVHNCKMALVRML